MSDSRHLETIRESADAYGVSDQTIRYHISKGRIPVYRREGERAALVDPSEVAAALRAYGRPGYRSYGPDADVRDLPGTADGYDVEDVRR